MNSEMSNKIIYKEMLKAENPYIPGTGSMPPHLAGRAGEKEEIEAAIARINSKPVSPGGWDRAQTMLRRMIGKKTPDKLARLERVSPPLTLIGPRGVGKTALLGWAKLRAEKLGVRYAVISEKLLGEDGELLGRAVMGQQEYDEAAKETTTSLSVRHPAKTSFDVKGQTTHPAAVMGLESIIDMQLRKGPLLLILDEAHAVAPKLLKEFFIAVQGFQDENRPLALVLAGTPGLRGVLRGIEATFMERTELMSLSLLTKEQTREALSIPAADTGVPMDNDALETMVEWTDCYPYFIQLAGRYSWETAKRRGSSKITLADASQALGEAGKSRRSFYYGRLKELVRMNIVPYAMQFIELLERQPGKEMDYLSLIDGFEQANDGMAQERAVEITEMMLNIGFIYEKQEMCEAGIPSLFDYVKEQKNKVARGNK